jgi:hypothetical protein
LTASGGRPWATAIFGVGELVVARDGGHQRLDNARVERGAAGGHHADGLNQLIAFGEVIL